MKNKKRVLPAWSANSHFRYVVHFDASLQTTNKKFGGLEVAESWILGSEGES